MCRLAFPFWKCLASSNGSIEIHSLQNCSAHQPDSLCASSLPCVAFSGFRMHQSWRRIRFGACGGVCDDWCNRSGFVVHFLALVLAQTARVAFISTHNAFCSHSSLRQIQSTPMLVRELLSHSTCLLGKHTKTKLKCTSYLRIRFVIAT